MVHRHSFKDHFLCAICRCALCTSKLSGTERQHVADDYAVRLSRASIEAEDVMKSALVYLMSGNQNCEDTISTVVKTNAKRHKAYLLEEMDSPNTSQYLRKGIELEQCSLMNINYCPKSENELGVGKSLVVVIYNPLGWIRQEFVKIPVSSSALEVLDSDGAKVEVQFVPIDPAARRVRDYYAASFTETSVQAGSLFNLYFEVSVPALGYSVYFIKATKSEISWTSKRPQDFNGDIILDSTEMRMVFSNSTGLMKQIIGVGAALHYGEKEHSSSCGDNKRVHLQDFLKLGDTVGLCLHPASLKLAMYRAWPIMHDNRFSLYKTPEQKCEKGREHAGLWAGTFGWPPGRPPEDKPRKVLFFLLLSYEDTEEGQLLIATKILEGTHYVLHPNGSAMFTARVNEDSSETFPWETDRDSTPVENSHAYQGEGIANGYGFRYPGSKPGDFFVSRKGFLAFVWRESRAVLTLQRIDLQALLKRGERVAALPPIANFAYLTKSYSNMFAGFSGLPSVSLTRYGVKLCFWNYPVLKVMTRAQQFRSALRNC